MAQIAGQIGLSREQLYRSFRANGNSTLKTTLAVINALGIELTAKFRWALDQNRCRNLGWKFKKMRSGKTPCRTRFTTRPSNPRRCGLNRYVLAWLKGQGKGYQTRMNAILREAMLRSLQPKTQESKTIAAFGRPTGV